jgi:predicted nuclease with TOPRIM domain
MVFLNWDNVIEQSKQDVDNYDQRIQTLKDDLKSVRKAKDEGMYTLEQAKAEADEIQQKLTVLEIERSEIRIEQYNTEVVKEFSERFMRNLPLLWDNLDLPKRQALLSKVFQGTIIAGKDKIIRTSKLSPSFELIQSLAEEKGENVSQLGSAWNT